MKLKVAFIVLAVVAIGLGIGLISMKNQATKQHDDDVATIAVHSNQWVDVTKQLEEQKQKSTSLEKDVASGKDEISKLSNTLTQTSENLSKTEAALKAQQEETAKRDAKIAERDAKIAELENQNTALDKQATDLKGSINNLEAQIADTQKKLDASEGDKAFLTKELNRLMAEKAELEKKFNDLTVLRDQVKKLREELTIARRVDWIRNHLFAAGEEKGAQKLMENKTPAFGPITAPKAKPTNAYDLNVEINSDGSVKVIPPVTNAPPVPASTNK